MEKRMELVEAIGKQRVLPLFYHEDESVCVHVAWALYKAGIRLIEFTNRGDQALKNFERLVQLRDRELEGLHLGAGTIKDSTAAHNFIQAGADFIVSPGISEEVYDVTYSEKILWIPGCMTISEIMKVEQFGISLVKLFPGNILGPSFIQSTKEIFPGLKFMPTGGVSLEKENLRAWFDAGAFAVGMGSKLLSREIMEQKEYNLIKSKMEGLLELTASL